MKSCKPPRSPISIRRSKSQRGRIDKNDVNSKMYKSMFKDMTGEELNLDTSVSIQ